MKKKDLAAEMQQDQARQEVRDEFDKFIREMRYQIGQQYEKSDLYQAFLAGAQHGLTVAMRINKEVHKP